MAINECKPCGGVCTHIPPCQRFVITSTAVDGGPLCMRCYVKAIQEYIHNAPNVIKNTVREYRFSASTPTSSPKVDVLQPVTMDLLKQMRLQGLSVEADALKQAYLRDKQAAKEQLAREFDRTARLRRAVHYHRLK